MSSKGVSIFEAIGGYEAVTAVVEDFYKRVLGDDRVNHHFQKVAMVSQRGHMVKFLVAALGGPTEYKGRNMREAHAHLGLTEGDFSAIAGHLQDTLTGAGVDPDNLNTIMSVVGGLKDEVLGK